MRTLVILLAALALWPSAAAAHVESTGYSEIRQDGTTVDYRLGLEFQPLADAAGLGTEPLAAQRERVADYVLPRLDVAVDGKPCEGSLATTAPEQRQGKEFAVLGLAFECPEGEAHTVRYEIFDPAEGDVRKHDNIADYAFAEHSGRHIFDAGHPTLDPRDESFLESISHFVTMGAEHILLGFDHVIFLVVLLLGARTLREVALLATTFTLAHSTTLVLASLGVVNVPGEIVEPLIALSIAYVAIATVLGSESRFKLPIVFCFGLLHGLGFAGTVSFTEDALDRLLTSLVSFNLGIELGQALIIALLFPLLLLIRRYGWSGTAHAAAGSAAAAVGLFWFAERLPNVAVPALRKAPRATPYRRG